MDSEFSPEFGIQSKDTARDTARNYEANEGSFRFSPAEVPAACAHPQLWAPGG
ncbi:hypothetical protein H633G_05269 [Metarhizium anisopliae BRIP 53284]|nr:hypothetical protein H633G_05269 [Metarhizium anisopliae BRIP 53284]